MGSTRWRWRWGTHHLRVAVAFEVCTTQKPQNLINGALGLGLAIVEKGAGQPEGRHLWAEVVLRGGAVSAGFLLLFLAFGLGGLSSLLSSSSRSRCN